MRKVVETMKYDCDYDTCDITMQLEVEINGWKSWAEWKIVDRWGDVKIYERIFVRWL